MPATVPQSAAVYLRISLDQQEGAGVERQKEDCLALAKHHGWTIGQVYEDNNISAYRANVVRPAWTRMLDDLRSGERDGLIVYDLDRVARRPRDLEDLINIVEQRKTRVLKATGELKLNDSTDILVARIAVSVANKSSADTGRRVARAALQRAQQGKPASFGKWRIYGYTMDMQVKEEEAVRIREWCTRVIAGESLTTIARELKDVPSVTGVRWTRATIKKIIARPENAGIRTYKGEEVATGNWTPIIDRATHEAVLATSIVRKRDYSIRYSNAHKYLLTGIAVCGLCGNGLNGRKNRNGQYTCLPSNGGCNKITRKQQPLDEMIDDMMVQRLAGITPAEVEENFNDLDISAVEAEMKENLDARKNGLITMSDFIDLQDDARARLKALQSKKAKNVVLATDMTVASRWSAGTLTAKRAVLKNHIKAVVVGTVTTPGSHVFDYKSVEVIWKE